MMTSARDLSSPAYPWNVVDEEMLRRVFRHRVLNSVAGLGLMVDALRERGTTRHPALPARCDAMQQELAVFQQLAEQTRQGLTTVPESGAPVALQTNPLPVAPLHGGCGRFHKLLAGVRSELGTAPRGGLDAWFTERCDLMDAEPDGLTCFAARVDLLFGPLPEPEPWPVGKLLSSATHFFSHRFPLCPFSVDRAPDEDSTLRGGNLYWLALQELLANGGEAAGRHGAVQLFWDAAAPQALAVVNSGEPWPADIPCDPARPFHSSRGRHDGLGLAIAQRLCEALEAELRIRPNLPNAVVVMMVAKGRGHAHG